MQGSLARDHEGLAISGCREHAHMIGSSFRESSEDQHVACSHRPQTTSPFLVKAMSHIFRLERCKILGTLACLHRGTAVPN